MSMQSVGQIMDDMGLGKKPEKPYLETWNVVDGVEGPHKYQRLSAEYATHIRDGIQFFNIKHGGGIEWHARVVE